MSIIQNAVKTSVFFLSAYKKYYTVKQSFKQNPPDFLLQYIIYCTLTAELGTHDNFRNNATMLRGQKIVDCHVVANFSNIEYC